MIKIDRDYGIEAIGTKLDIMYELTIGIKSLYDRNLLTKKDLDTIIHGVTAPKEEIEKETSDIQKKIDMELNALKELKQQMIDLHFSQETIDKISKDIETAEKTLRDLMEDR